MMRFVKGILLSHYKLHICKKCNTYSRGYQLVNRKCPNCKSKVTRV